MLKPFSDKARKPNEWSANDIGNLQIQWKKSDPEAFEVPLKKVLVCPQVFQVRNLLTKSKAGITNADHVAKLALRLDEGIELDPILVLPISANRFVVIDGTHRRAAYDRRQRQTIPVKVFTGTLADARVAAGRSDNAKKRLEWTSAEKSQYLYQLVLERLQVPSAQRMTQKQCAEAADRTERLARHMEKHIQRFKDENRPVPDKWNGGAWAKDDEETESAEDRMVTEYLQQLAGFGKLTPARAQALGRALAMHTEHAGAVASAMVEAGGLHDQVVADFSEMIAEQADERAAGLVGSTRSRMVEIEQHVQDIRTRATIANFLFDASLYAGSAEHRFRVPGIETNVTWSICPANQIGSDTDQRIA